MVLIIVTALPLYKPGQVIRPQSSQAFHFRQKGGFFLVVFFKVGIYCSVRTGSSAAGFFVRELSPTTYYIGLLPYLFIDMGTKAEGNTSPTWNLVDPQRLRDKARKSYSQSEQVRFKNCHSPRPYTQNLFSSVKTGPTVYSGTQISDIHVSLSKA